MTGVGGRDERGFTLTEVLVVVIVLGVLAAIVVLAVSGLSERGSGAAAESDERTIVQAEEAFFAKQPVGSERYASEAELVADKMLQGPSTMHDVCLSGDARRYKIVAAGTDCSTVTV